MADAQVPRPPQRTRTVVGRRTVLAGAATVAAAWSAGAVAARLTTGLDEPASGAVPAQRLDPPDGVEVYDPNTLYVALYGHPGTPVLGALGEQGPAAAADRARRLAADYARFGGRVMPAFELIGSVAASVGRCRR